VVWCVIRRCRLMSPPKNPPLKSRHPAPAHYTVQMRVEHQGLAPGMPRRDEARLRPPILGSAQQLTQPFPHGRTQEIRHGTHIRQPQAAQLIGQRNDDMVMVTRQQSGVLTSQPALDLEPAALGTQPGATRVVLDPLDMPLRAGLDVTTKHSRPTDQARPRRPPHVVRPPVTLREGRIACLEDLLDRTLGITSPIAPHPRPPQDAG
ncbi:MAG: hypothetical protein ACRERE_34610, partial [Candidatus Entotheonellia bacterium]